MHLQAAMMRENIVRRTWSFVKVVAVNPLPFFLAIHLTASTTTSTSTATATDERVQIWHRSKYHWYLKQELEIGNNNNISNTNT
mmetsp:Transcript_11275/g.14857  ORF Transcript_11275/g.14857 Transcript_11275/m.14857 type:complete len:84 (+) Transcript_11275:349-600(+)